MSLLVGRNNNGIENNDTNNQSIGSSALQKAIERNRLKQLEKGQNDNGSNFLENFNQNRINQPTPQIEKPSISIEEKLKQLKAPSTPNLLFNSSNSVSGSLSSSSQLQSINRIGISNLGLEGIGKTKSKWLNFKENFFGYVLKVFWIFSVFILLRLVFTERGVLEYYLRRKKIQEKFDILEKQLLANNRLKKEIERIERDITYQKGLVRNNLGFIAEDEFIIVLPDSKNNFSK